MTTTSLDFAGFAINGNAQDVLFRQARTANSFAEEPVTDEQIQALYDLVKWAPTSMNAQPLRLILVQSDDAKTRLYSHLNEGNRPKAQSAPLVAVLAADTNFHEHMPRLFAHSPNAKSMFEKDDAAREQFARNQAWLQAGYFILGVRALGLAAGPMGGYNASGLDNDLLAGTGLKSIMVVNIGTPGDNPWFDRLPRLTFEEAVTSL